MVIACDVRGGASFLPTTTCQTFLFVNSICFNITDSISLYVILQFTLLFDESRWMLAPHVTRIGLLGPILSLASPEDWFSRRLNLRNFNRTKV